MTYSRRDMFLVLLGCLLTACGRETTLPISTSTPISEAVISSQVSQIPTQETTKPQIDNIITTSPNELYIIACQFPELALLDGKSGAKISDLNLGYSAAT
jgi:hypothetical protein